MSKQKKIWSHPIYIQKNHIKLEKTFNFMFEITLTQGIDSDIINSLIEYDQILRILNYTYNDLKLKRVNSVLHIKHKNDELMKGFIRCMKDLNIVEPKYLVQNRSETQLKEIYFTNQKIDIDLKEKMNILNSVVDVSLFSEYNDPLFIKYVMMHNTKELTPEILQNFTAKWDRLKYKKFIKNPILSVDALSFLYYNIDIPGSIGNIEKLRKLKKEIDLNGILSIMGLTNSNLSKV